MKRSFLRATALLFIIAGSITACDKNDYNDTTTPPPQEPQGTVLSAAGDSGSVIGTINQFRALLGDSLNFVTGKTTGRREINWDGVPPDFSNNNNFPPDFFNAKLATDPAGRKRGLEYINAGDGFRVDSTSFSEIDESYANQFAIFSKKRLFAQIGNNIYDAVFKIAGTNTDAFVHGFGLIFSDVDDAYSTTLEFFSGAKSLGVYKAKNAGSKFSFLGVYFQNEKVTRVRITSGNGVLKTGNKDITDGGTYDLVVLDDFFYDEPKSIH